jgi:arginine deiminase
MDAGFQTRTGALIVALHGSNPLDRSRSRITKLKSDIAKLEKAIEQTLHPVIKDQDQKQDRAVVEAALAGKPAPEHVFTRDEQKEEAQRRRSALKAEKKKLETELNEIIGSALAELADAAKELAERVDAGDRAELEKYGLPYETSKTVWAIRAFAHRLSGRTATCQTAYYCRAFAEELLQK